MPLNIYATESRRRAHIVGELAWKWQPGCVRSLAPGKAGTFLAIVVAILGPAGDWSIFRPEDSVHEKNDSRRHGPVPLLAEVDGPP